MSAFADYLDLRTAVVEHVGNASITDVFPRLVLLAESRFNRDFRMRQQITATTVTFTDGVAPLPIDFLEVIGLYRANGYELVQQTLQHIANKPHCYAIDGQDILMPGFSGDLQLEYYSGIPSITGAFAVPILATSPGSSYYGVIGAGTVAGVAGGGVEPTGTNWLLVRYPDVYFYGVGFEAAKHVKDAELASITNGLMRQAISDARSDDHRSRYSRARVRVAGCTP